MFIRRQRKQTKWSLTLWWRVNSWNKWVDMLKDKQKIEWSDYITRTMMHLSLMIQTSLRPLTLRNGEYFLLRLFIWLFSHLDGFCRKIAVESGEKVVPVPSHEQLTPKIVGIFQDVRGFILRRLHYTQIFSVHCRACIFSLSLQQRRITISTRTRVCLFSYPCLSTSLQ